MQQGAAKGARAVDAPAGEAAGSGAERLRAPPPTPRQQSRKQPRPQHLPGLGPALIAESAAGGSRGQQAAAAPAAGGAPAPAATTAATAAGAATAATAEATQAGNEHLHGECEEMEGESEVGTEERAEEAGEERPACSHCGTHATSRWIRSPTTGKHLCYACYRHKQEHGGQMRLVGVQGLQCGSGSPGNGVGRHVAWRPHPDTGARWLCIPCFFAAQRDQRHCMECGAASHGGGKRGCWLRHPDSGAEWLCHCCYKKCKRQRGKKDVEEDEAGVEQQGAQQQRSSSAKRRVEDGQQADNCKRRRTAERQQRQPAAGSDGIVHLARIAVAAAVPAGTGTAAAAAAAVSVKCKAVEQERQRQERQQRRQQQGQARKQQAAARARSPSASPRERQLPGQPIQHHPVAHLPAAPAVPGSKRQRLQPESQQEAEQRPDQQQQHPVRSQHHPQPGEEQLMAPQSLRRLAPAALPDLQQRDEHRHQGTARVQAQQPLILAQQQPAQSAPPRLPARHNLSASASTQRQQQQQQPAAQPQQTQPLLPLWPQVPLWAGRQQQPAVPQQAERQPLVSEQPLPLPLLPQLQPVQQQPPPPPPPPQQQQAQPHTQPQREQPVRFQPELQHAAQHQQKQEQQGGGVGGDRGQQLTGHLQKHAHKSAHACPLELPRQRQPLPLQPQSQPGAGHRPVQHHHAVPAEQWQQVRPHPEQQQQQQPQQGTPQDLDSLLLQAAAVPAAAASGLTVQLVSGFMTLMDTLPPDIRVARERRLRLLLQQDLHDGAAQVMTMALRVAGFA